MLKMKTQDMNQFFSNIKTSEFLYILWGVFLLFLTTQISIPLEPVPITLQTFGIMLLGLTFERKIALKSILSYLSLGAVGVPVFANFKGGAATFMSPTGGYLLGFLVAIVVMVNLRKYFKQETFWNYAFIAMMGTLSIFVCGILWLTHFMNLEKAIQVGFLPFVVPGIVKILLLALSVKYVKSGYFFK